jgi:hypothetical protein
VPRGSAHERIRAARGRPASRSPRRRTVDSARLGAIAGARAGRARGVHPPASSACRVAVAMLPAPRSRRRPAERVARARNMDLPEHSRRRRRSARNPGRQRSPARRIHRNARPRERGLGTTRARPAFVRGPRSGGARGWQVAGRQRAASSGERARDVREDAEPRSAPGAVTASDWFAGSSGACCRSQAFDLADDALLWPCGRPTRLADELVRPGVPVNPHVATAHVSA